MKKLFLVCLMMLAGSAWAEWVFNHGTNRTNFYHDPATIRKEGNMRRVWELQDFKERRKGGEMSFRLRSEYDCKQERHRFLYLSGHDEPMAGGTVLSSDDADQPQWESIAPGTNAEFMLNIVCAK